ncbi:MAG: hypothetical protein NUW09_00155 [Deltaproteobacteria bacterium]|nr:hypothetical protein [Deltaproteobacteria bacterium]
MNISVNWKGPIKLSDGKQAGLIYSIDLDRIPDSAGVYVFCRKHSKNYEALYVGKANNLRSRVKGQLNHLKLMKHMRDAQTGERCLFLGAAIMKQGQNSDKVIRIIERTLIRHFISYGHNLVNQQGITIREHEIEHDGNRPKKIIPMSMFLEK